MFFTFGLPVVPLVKRLVKKINIIHDIQVKTFNYIKNGSSIVTSGKSIELPAILPSARSL